MSRGASLAAVALALGATACARRAPDDPCGAHHPASLEVRDGQGALLLAARAAASDAGQATHTLCDGAGRPVARLVEAGGRLTLLGPRGGELARAGRDGDERVLERLQGGCLPGAPPPGNAAATTGPPPCPRLRLYQGGELLRLLDEHGVPLGQIARRPATPGDALPDGGAPGRSQVAVLDPGGRTIALVERVEPQDDTRLAVRDPESGRTRLLLLGLRPERAAAALALPSLELPEQLLLAALLARPGDD